MNNGAIAHGEAGLPAFPLFPQFVAVELPTNVFLMDRNALGQSVKTRVHPIRAWQGILTPFANDTEAKQVLRSLAADRPIAVDGGRLVPMPESAMMKVQDAESRMSEMSISFDVLVLEFEPPAHPWVFSLSPPIFQRPQRHHPHLRSDRLLELPSRTLHGFCVYSASEFTFESSQPVIPQFLAQVSIFLGKHAVWMRTQRLFGMGRKILHDGIDLSTVASTIPVDACWQRRPATFTTWVGYWPGTGAENGANHLLLDPNKECWCGKGRLYKDCCLIWEQPLYENAK